MKAPHLWIRIGPFLLALLLGLAGWNGSPVSSQPQEEGGFQWYALPESPPESAPLGLAGAGHVYDQVIVRCPAVGPCIFPVSDKILFTQDIFGALAIYVSGAAVYDRWTWSYYYSGNPPGGGVPDMTCWAEMREPGDEGNPTEFVALVTDCTWTGELEVVKTFPSGCPCAFAVGGGPYIAGLPPASRIGTWTVIVDYTDPDGVITEAVAQDNMYLMQTPAVVLIPGYGADCDGLTTLEQNIEQELAVTDDRVKCFEYNSRKGVASPVGKDAPGDLDRFLVNFRQELGMDPDDEVDLVGHSMGGLVARYLAQRDWWSVKIGSVSMLGTPNEGVLMAKMEKALCPIAAIPAALIGYHFGGPLGLVFGEWAGTKTCKAAENWVGGLFDFDPDSQAVKDMVPGSKLLDGLNIGFVLPQPPVLPAYRAHAGLHSTAGGKITSGSDTNDCLVSRDSVAGREDVFRSAGNPFYEYETLTHGDSSWPGCEPPTLTDDMSVVQDLAVTIKGNPGGGALAAEPLAQAEAGGPGLDSALLAALVDYVHQSQVNTHQLSLPAGLGDTAFAVYWPDAGDPPLNLGVTLRRPNEQVVDPEDSDVLADLTGVGGGFLDTLVAGFVMSAPQEGEWELTVEGLSAPSEGVAYLIAVMPDSQVVLTTAVAVSDLAQGQPQVITATLFDDSTAIAPTSISALVGTPEGTAEDVILLDDGTGGDETDGDLTYSGTFASTAECGRYGVVAIASGESSEGAVTRGQIGSFQSQAPGDAVRQPCNPDDDEDGLTDYDELNVVGTDPLDEDTDDDGLADGQEVNTYGTDPVDADTDDDAFRDGVEVYLGTDPTDACPDNSADDAWPLDIDMDKNVTVVGDVLKYSGRVGTHGPPNPSPNWLQRLDLNMDNSITVVGDILKFSGKVGTSCT